MWTSFAAAQVEVLAERPKLTASDGRTGDYFGTYVDLDGNRLAVTASGRDKFGVEAAGFIYIYERDDSGRWIEETKFTSPDVERFDLFGKPSLDGNRLAVGVSQDDDCGFFLKCGSAYIFDRNELGTWVLKDKVLGSDPISGDNFGASVSLDGDRLAVGASISERVFIFETVDSTNWLEVALLDLVSSLEFGRSVSLDGDRIAVGDPGDYPVNVVHVFERNPSGLWVEIDDLVASDTDRGRFGESLVLEGDRLLVGAPSADRAEPDFGAAYVFERDGSGSWIETAILKASDGAPGDRFGEQVSLSGDRIAVANLRAGISGAVYVFELDVKGNWAEVAKLRPLDRTMGDSFGYAISLDEDSLAVGARHDDDRGEDSGSAYIFESVVVQPKLNLAGTCPGSVEATVEGITPRSPVVLFGSDVLGSDTLPSGPCAGTELSVETPVSVKHLTSGFGQTRVLQRTVDTTWCGRYLQLIDERTCLTSEVVQVPEARLPNP